MRCILPETVYASQSIQQSIKLILPFILLINGRSLYTDIPIWVCILKTPWSYYVKYDKPEGGRIDLCCYDNNSPLPPQHPGLTPPLHLSLYQSVCLSASPNHSICHTKLHASKILWEMTCPPVCLFVCSFSQSFCLSVCLLLQP